MKQKKILYTVLCAAAVMLLVSGCTQPESADSGKSDSSGTLASELASLSTPVTLTNEAAAAYSTTESDPESSTEDSVDDTTTIPVRTITTRTKVTASAKYDTQYLLNPSLQT
jgi:hypothetical protein